MRNLTNQTDNPGNYHNLTNQSDNSANCHNQTQPGQLGVNLTLGESNVSYNRLSEPHCAQYLPTILEGLDLILCLKGAENSQAAKFSRWFKPDAGTPKTRIEAPKLCELVPWHSRYKDSPLSCLTNLLN